MGQKLLLGIFFVMLSGCHSHKENIEVRHSVLHVNVEPMDTKVRLSDVAASSLVVLPTSDSLLMNEINHIHCKDDFVYIADPSVVYKFSTSGECLGKIHRQGNGPEEYSSISDFQIDNNDNVWILSRSSKSVNCYSWGNRLINRFTQRLWMENIFLDGDTLYVYTGNDMGDNNDFQLHSLNIGTPQTVYNFHPVDRNKAEYLFVKGKNVFQKSNSKVYFTQIFNDTVYTLTSETCNPAFIIDFSGKNVPSSFYDQKYENIMDFFQKLHKEDRFAYGIDCFVETEHTYWVGYFYKRQRRVAILSKNQENSPICFRTLLVDQLCNYPVDLSDVTLFVQDDGRIVIPLQSADIMEYARTHLSQSEQDSLAGKLHYVEDQNPLLLVLKLF